MFFLPLLALLAIGQGGESEIDRALRIEENYRGKAYRLRVQPNWQPDGGLWYRVDTSPSTQEWVSVSGKGKLERFTDYAGFQKAAGRAGASKPLSLSPTLRFAEVGERVDLDFTNQGTQPIQLFWVNDNERVPYATVAPGKTHSQSTFAGHAWEVREVGGKSLGYVTTPPLGGNVIVNGPAQAEKPAEKSLADSGPRPWRLTIREHNVWAQPPTGGEAFALSREGKPTDTYAGSGIHFSPDGKRAVVFRTVPEETHQIHLVESTPRDQVQPKLRSIQYLKPGDRIAHPRPVLFDLEARKAIPLDDSLLPNPWSLPAIGESGWGTGVTWAADGKSFFFAYNERGHQLMRVLKVDAETGTVRTLFEDRTKTFIHYSGKFWARYLARSNEILWMSERDGWNHLYVHDAETGAVKRQLTKGAWVVEKVESFDEEKGTAVIRYSGRHPDQDPYHDHFARISIRDGKLTPLTEGDGTHRLTWSPDGGRYLDTYSRVDAPPVTELRDGKSGKLLATLEKADIKELAGTGWRAPERFVAKGRDGKTDIWGVVWYPRNHDPKKRYPVIEQIYAGPHSHHVPKQWSPTYGTPQELNELGFVVVMIDGMGTDGRGKAFHDVAWKNLKDAGFPDRMAWMKALQAKDPSLDLTRVGIYGGSAGGQNAMAALLWHGDFYKAAAADCGCHDNRMDKIWWNEQWMGYPVDASYEASSNRVHANRLQGDLLLTVGELDTNVDPATTLQVADALIKANKKFELIVFPGGGHGAGESAFGQRRRMEFFIRALRP